MKNEAWQKNRNLYAELLLLMIKQQNLIEPFTKVPPDSSLPVIQKSNFPFLYKKKGKD